MDIFPITSVWKYCKVFATVEKVTIVQVFCPATFTGAVRWQHCSNTVRFEPLWTIFTIYFISVWHFQSNIEAISKIWIRNPYLFYFSICYDSLTFLTGSMLVGPIFVSVNSLDLYGYEVLWTTESPCIKVRSDYRLKTNRKKCSMNYSCNGLALVLDDEFHKKTIEHRCSFRFTSKLLRTDLMWFWPCIVVNMWK